MILIFTGLQQTNKIIASDVSQEMLDKIKVSLKITYFLYIRNK